MPPFSPAPFATFASEILPPASPLRARITAAYRIDERAAVQSLLQQISSSAFNTDTQLAHAFAQRLVQTIRAKRTRASGVDALMHEFSLSSEEGVALMCLAEALLRIPDKKTADALIADKISKGNWRKHLGESPSLFVNAATWGLLITGKLVSTQSEHGLSAAITRLVAKGGEPLIRKSVDLAMRLLGNQFVCGQTILEALQNSRANQMRGYSRSYSYSYDMLGEAALTAADADRYYAAYETAIHAIGQANASRGLKESAGISVKLSALHPRYCRAQRQRVMNELLPRLKQLLVLCKKYQIGLNIDAEEADRLELSLDLMEALAFDPALQGFDGIGFVVQAYQKRAPFVLDYLIDLAQRSGHRFMIRLVKGAYWDTEIKRAQVDGLCGYPVFTRKVYTDLSYLVCAQKMLEAAAYIYPQFATHNALTMATVYAWANERKIDDYEFQCLYGMGETLYDQVVQTSAASTTQDKILKTPCRIYAPVGSHQTLLAYLVRRLLENGANSSFVNQIVDPAISIDALLVDPVQAARALGGVAHPQIPLPRALFGDERANSAGIDLSNEDNLRALAEALDHFSSFEKISWRAQPLLAGDIPAQIGDRLNSWQAITNPARPDDQVGQVRNATAEDVECALQAAVEFAPQWRALPVAERVQSLQNAADLFERHQFELIALAIREAGKSLANAIAEIREAVDFLRYYAAQMQKFPQHAPSSFHATELSQAVANHPDAWGPIVCISPWNFPLAIFTGQISAALASGNVVLAKPAEQTPLIAARAVELLHVAGIPRAALQFLPGAGETIGAALTADARTAGVIFTGSLEVAKSIQRTLAERGGDLPLIAETGGQNALIVDSSALPEQVVQDILSSAFDSAGQRCSALRILCLQTDIAEQTLEMLKGALRELRVGNPDRLSTDIGPVIDAEAQKNLCAHIERMRAQGVPCYQLPLDPAISAGSFVPPTLLELKSIEQVFELLTQEVFGPVLHVVRYRREALGELIEALNRTGYGLTLGIHSRIDETVNFIAARAHVGNIYVNRNIVGAVVGVQPFGGEGKSGTGPKAGGPFYLARLQRGAHPPVHSQAQPTPRTPTVLQALLDWSQERNQHKLADLIAHYVRTTLLDATLVLPGPTGERNTLSFAARGTILCVASKTEILLNQIAATLATGNTPVLDARLRPLLPADLPSAIQSTLLIGDSDLPNLRLALVETAQADLVRRRFSQQKQAALVMVVETFDLQPIPLWRLVAERALCVNTTAAGGNASLMMLDS